MRRPRVMLGADSLRRGASGIARVARLMAKALAEQARAGQIEAEAIVLSDTAAPDDLGIPVRTVHGSRARFVYEMHRAALRCSHFAYDFTGIARAHPRLVWPRRPYLTWIHGIEIWEDARADRLRRAQQADVLLANSEYTRSRAQGLHANLNHARVCWLATEEDDAPAQRSNAASQTALVLSRLDDAGGYKGHRELIAAWPAVVRALPDARLLIAGDGPGMAVIRAWAVASPVSSHIELRGFVPEAALDGLWQQAALFAMPSRGEGFGIAYIEAMRRGVPVIGSVHDAAREINPDGNNGYNVDLGVPHDLETRLVHLLADPKELQRLGDAASARWRERFHYRAFATRFLPFLGELIAR